MNRPRLLLRQALFSFPAPLSNLVKNPLTLASALVVILFALMALLAPFIAPYNPNQVNLEARLQPPSPEHWLGTDALGRDLLSRVIFGARVSILVGVSTIALAAFIGVSLGLLAGYFRGAFDAWLSRFTEVLLAFPYLIFAIGMMAFLGPGFWNLVFALAFLAWVEFFRLVRGETLSQSTREYVEAARALGYSHSYILLSEILPNILPSILVLATLRIGYMMVMEASLSFLGVGIPPGIPAWGSMISEGKDVLFLAWWVSTFPGLALLVLVLAINLLGEHLRETLDPRLRARR